MKNESEKLYEIYMNNRTVILNVAKEQESIVKDLGLNDVKSEGAKICDVLDGIINKLETDTLKVFVIGRFNSGKSTFINALFGQPVLPSSPKPTTGVLCEIKYANDAEKRAMLFPKKGMGINGNDAPFEVPILNLQEELKKYVVIKKSGTETTSETSRYQKLELYYPLSLCKNNIEIIDSVGLEDPEYRDKVVFDYLPSVDVIIYCMDSQSAYTRTDKTVFDLLKSLKYSSIFFVITKIDLLKGSFDMGEITETQFKNDTYDDLSPWTTLKRDGIKFINSTAALSGKMQNNEAMIASSGITEIERDLETFLIREKGQAKLLSTLDSLMDINRSVRKVIPSRISMLQLSAEELEKRYNEAKVPLKTLEMKRKLIINQFETKRNDIAREAYDMANVYCTELSAKIRTWASEYEITSPLGVVPTESKINAIVTEITEYIKIKIEDDTVEWTGITLSPLIESRVEELKASLEDQARDFVRSADLVRLQISVGSQFDPGNITKEEKVSTVGRLIGIGYMCLTGDIITGGLGAALGIKAMVTTITCQLIGGLVLGLLGLVSPVGLIAVGLAGIGVGNLVGRESIKDGIKKKVGNQIASEVEKNGALICKNVETNVINSLGKMKSALDAGLMGEINSVSDEVENILNAKKTGTLDVNNQIKGLRELEVINTNIEEKLEKLRRDAGIMDKTVLEVPRKVGISVPVPKK